jgi:hypothetical protein
MECVPIPLYTPLLALVWSNAGAINSVDVGMHGVDRQHASVFLQKIEY